MYVCKSALWRSNIIRLISCIVPVFYEKTESCCDGSKHARVVRAPGSLQLDMRVFLLLSGILCCTTLAVKLLGGGPII